MKSIDITPLKNFYATDAGISVARKIALCVGKSLEIKEENVLSLGFCGNFLDLFEFRNLYYGIPEGYPLTHWPKIRPFRTLVLDPKRMPFSPETWDVVIVIHFMEFFPGNRDFLKELSRILKKNGKLVIVCMNKRIFNFFYAGLPNVKNIRRGADKIIEQLGDESFRIASIFGVSGRFQFWPYKFSHKLNKYNEILIKFFPFLSDVTVIFSNKTELATVGVIRELDAQYDVT